MAAKNNLYGAKLRKLLLSLAPTALTPQSAFALILWRYLKTSFPLWPALPTSEALAKYSEHFKSEILVELADMLGSLDKSQIELFERTVNFKPTLDDLTLIFEDSYTESETVREGIFYTPLQIVKHMVGEALAPCTKDLDAKELLNLRILDPACGSGIFLRHAFIYLIDACGLSGMALMDFKREVLSSCLYGVDKNETAVKITKLILQLTLLESEQLELLPGVLPDLSGNIKCGNSLIEPNELSIGNETHSLKPFSWRENFPAIMEQGGFDCVIGNPPYGLSRNEKLSPQENLALREIYSKELCGKINKYLVFLSKSYDLLHPRGALCFIVPNAWLGIKSGMPLRKRFLQDRSLQSITVFECPVFDEVSVEAVIVKLSRAKPRDFFHIFRSFSLDTKADKFSTVSVKSCTAPEFIIPTNWNSEVGALLNYIDRQSKPLEESIFTPLIALQAYARGAGQPAQSADDVKKHVFHVHEKVDDSAYPYLEGSDISRYKISWSGSYLKYGPWLAEPQQLERYIGPRLVLREIIRPLPYVAVAAFTDKTYLYNKSVLHILPKHDYGQLELLALLSILNSKLGSLILHFRGRKSQRKIFPKIVNEDLKRFPVPLEFGANVRELSDLSRLFTEDDTSSQTLQNTIDQAVYRAYKLKNSQVLNLEQLFKAR